MLVLAHRGASAGWPENTLAAFEAARAQGADGVELDVRRLADGTPAVHHDAHLPDGRALTSLVAADLPDWVPDLASALDVCSGMACVNVEIKNLPGDPDFGPDEALAEAVVSILGARPDRSRVLVSSFHLPTIERVRALDSSLATGWLRLEVRDLASELDLLAAGGHRAIHPHAACCTPELLDAAHERALAVYTWTVDDAEQIRRFAAMGVDAVITNDPAAALAALGR